MQSTRVLVTVIGGVLLGTAGCGGGGGTTESSGLDTAKIESSLTSSFSGSSTSSFSTPTGPSVTDVACPDDVDAASGTSFDCDLSGEQGLKGSVTVTLESDDGTKFKYDGEAKTQGYSTKLRGSSTVSG